MPTTSTSCFRTRYPQSIFVAAVTLVWTCDGTAPSKAQSPQELFVPIAAVLRHPRCLYCHVSRDTPLNGDNGQPHRMKITRGADGLGAPGARCYACHREVPMEESFVPGAPNWKLPPRSPVDMAWEGLSTAELCRVFSNANPDPRKLIDHVETDKLVGWGWQPGPGRTAVPIARAEFVKLVKDWIIAEKPCPAP